MGNRERADWRPLVLALTCTLLILALTLGPRAQAVDHLFQTVPTPTPRTVPTPGEVETPRPSEVELPTASHLALRQTVNPRDVLADQELQYTLWLTNTSPIAITDLFLIAPLDPVLRPLEIQATQGAVDWQDETVLIHMGTIESGATALVVLYAQVAAEAQPGKIILNQFTAQFDGGPVRSNIVAASLPPDILPATGRDGRNP